MKLLVITQDVNRTGAPIVLLHFLKWLNKNNKRIEVSLLVLKKGELLDEFSSVVKHVYLKEDSRLKIKILRLLGKDLLTARLVHSSILKKIIAKKFDAIYSNTVLSIPYGSYISSKIEGCKHLAHIHELETTIQLLLPDFSKYISNITHFIAVSELVKTNLIEQWKIPETKISKIYEFSNTGDVELLPKQRSNSFLVGASGHANWRKGSDLFIQVANYLQQYFPETDIKFQWVGNVSKNQRLLLFDDLRKAGLQDCVTFLGQQKKPFEKYNAFDVFLMTSREDPFPLVCIEVGLLGKPIICFDNAVGTAEVLRKHGGGKIVPYLDIKAMAEAILMYKNNTDLLKEDGGKNKVTFSKFTPEEISPQILKVIEVYGAANEVG